MKIRLRVFWDFISTGVLVALIGAASATTPIRLAAQDAAAPTTCVIDRVTVVDVATGSLVADQRVVIDGMKITAMGPVDSVAIPADARVVDGHGKYLIPGLFDAHVHLTAGMGAYPSLLVAHGVTCVRDMGGPTQIILSLKRAAPDADPPSPDIVATGAIVDGDPPIWPFSEPCKTADDARAAVRKLAAAGVDQIKVYSMLTPEAYHAAVAEAQQVGLPAVGHVPFDVPIDEAVKAGQRSIEHLEGFAPLIAQLAPATDLPNVSGIGGKYLGWTRWSDVDREALTEHLAAHRDAGVFHCPTIVVMQGIGRAADEADPGAADPRMKYVPVESRGFWNRAQYEQFSPFARSNVPRMQELTALLAAAGVPIVVGTDLANPYVFAGSSVHDEMQLLVDAGLENDAVLRAATIAPAQLCGVDDSLGTVSVGKTASLVLLAANPLDEIAAVRQIDGVFLRGKYFDRSALDAMLSACEVDVVAATPETDATDTTMPDLPGTLVARGRYKMKFQQFDAGFEEFVITEDDSGWHVWSHNQPQGGGQQPSISRSDYDRNMNPITMKWKQLTSQPTDATYRVEDGVLIAEATQGEEKLDPVRLELPAAPHHVRGPDYASELVFFALVLSDAHGDHPSGLGGMAPGETREFQAVGFGFPDWKPAATPASITRHEDSTFEIEPGKSATARHFTGTLQTPLGKFTTETWTDERGLPLKSELTMPFGKVSAVLELASE